ncbi:HesA/MoeB/ThiF family protein [Actinokineospora sp. 24-640]
MTRVFLYQEQVETLWREVTASRAPRRRIALGMVLDDGEVCHVYIEPPRTHFAGHPCTAVVDFREYDGEEVTNLGARESARIVVLLCLRDNVIDGRAFLADGTGWTEGEVRIVPTRTELYVRSAGLVETSALARSRVAVVGLGSGGSMVATALAQSGVGELVLVDRDRLEIGNVSRHACGVGDLGRRKTAALRDLVTGKNPDVRVETHDIDVVERPESLRAALDGADLVIGATDGDTSRFLVNQMVVEAGVTAVFGRVLTRACGGDVLRVRPGRGPCLACVYTERFLAQRPREHSSVADARTDADAYTSAEDVAARVQVGLASDIVPVANLMTKLALVELSRGAGGHLESLDTDLVADFYVWANRREGTYAGWPEMGFSFNQPSVLRWYGADLTARVDCVVCAAPVAAVSDFFDGTGDDR